MLDLLVDQFLLRRGFYDAVGHPHLTTGTIVLGVLLRSMATIIAGFIIWEYGGIELSIPLTLALLWGYVTYPAYRQFTLLSQKTQDTQQELLCTQCRHFNPSGQYCLLYDEHVRPDYIPCNGSDWDPSE